MTTEAVVDPRRDPVGHVHKVGYANKVIKKKRFRRKTKRSAPPVPMVLQELFVSCKEVFRGPGSIPLPLDVKRLSNIIDDMEPEDVGLSDKLQFFQAAAAAKGTPRVSCTTIYKCDNFSLSIFFLPATAVIPLHNHPGMTVFSKLLLGTMHIKSYDWVNPLGTDEPSPSSRPRLARLVADRPFTAPCETSVLYPTTGGNIHQFTAITPCAVLDVFLPPYSKEDGRDCSYYKDFPYTSFSNGDTGMSKEDVDCYAWLEEIEAPENSKMDGIEYLGPQIVDTAC